MNLTIKTLLLSILFPFFSLSAAEIVQKSAVNLDELLKNLEQGQYRQSQENKKREKNFVQQKTQQQ